MLDIFKVTITGPGYAGLTFKNVKSKHFSAEIAHPMYIAEGSGLPEL